MLADLTLKRLESMAYSVFNSVRIDTTNRDERLSNRPLRLTDRYKRLRRLGLTNRGDRLGYPLSVKTPFQIVLELFEIRISTFATRARYRNDGIVGLELTRGIVRALNCETQNNRGGYISGAWDMFCDSSGDDRTLTPRAELALFEAIATSLNHFCSSFIRSIISSMVSSVGSGSGLSCCSICGSRCGA